MSAPRSIFDHCILLDRGTLRQGQGQNNTEPINIGIIYRPSWALNIAGLSTQQLLQDDAEMGLFMNFLLSPAYDSFRLWLVDPDSQLSDLAAETAQSNIHVFNHAIGRFVEAKSPCEVAGIPHDCALGGTAFGLLYGLMARLPITAWKRIYRVGVLVR